MPMYEYQCGQCGRRTEKRQKFSDAPLTVCPYCGGPLKKLISAPAVQFKGGGWYADGYGSKKPSSGSEGSASAATGEGGSSSTAKSEGATGSAAAETSKSSASSSSESSGSTASSSTSGSAASSASTSGK